MSKLEEERLVSANRDFYEAFESLDIKKMTDIWIHRDDIVCIHPGWDLITGWEPVEESWLRIFQSAEYMKFTITNVKATIKDSLGVIVCLENIESAVMGPSIRSGVLATNIFERVDGKWLMIHHHGSPVTNYFVPPASEKE